MAPTKIMFIRHGEKPPDLGGPPFGFDANGNPDVHSLIARGWSRAGALVAFFAAPQAPIEAPAVVFAASPATGPKSPHGQRPSETVAPLCAFRNIVADLTYSVGEEAQLAAAILVQDGVVLVSWEHQAISEIVAGILGTAFTNTWPDRFDLVWLLTQNTRTYDFSTSFQHLLSGDT